MTEDVKKLSTLDRGLVASLRHIPKTIWCLGVATFLMNASTIIIFSFSPLFLMASFSINAMGIGLIEAVVESMSWVMRIISGILSDYFRKRKVFVLISYTLAALARPIFPLANSAMWIFVGRMIDRVANGLQATPREALIADLAPPGLKGACFGLRQALGTAGSAVGAFLGVVVMKISGGNYQLVFWVATIPAVLAVALLVFMIEDPRFTAETQNPSKSAKKKFTPIDWKAIATFPWSFWVILIVTVIFLMGRFSGAFLITFAKHSGLPEHLAPTVMIIFNIFSTISAYPLGALSDRIDRKFALLIGFLMIIIADVILYFATSVQMVLLGVIFWGVQFGITQSIPMAMVADEAPKAYRGTAFGIFYLSNGVALFIANILAGYCMNEYGPHSAFMASGCIIVFAVIGIYFLRKETPSVASNG